MDGFLLWEPPGGALSILLPRGLLKRLQTYVEQVFGDPSADTGAVLLGHSEVLVESGRRVITIEDFESGVSRLRDRAVIGFIQCRKQRTLHLEETDFLLLKEIPEIVCLMVRPDRPGGALGGFFYREGKTVKYPSAAMQFPISPDAMDCRGLLCVGGREQPEDGNEEAPRRSTGKRLAFATAGLALILSPGVLWWTSHRADTPEPSKGPEPVEQAVQSNAAQETGSVAAPSSERHSKVRHRHVRAKRQNPPQ